MSILEEYNRENKFVRSLNIAFDNYIELNKEKIENLLNETDIFEIDEAPLPSISWNDIYKSSNKEYQSKLLNRFSYEVNRNQKRYKQILKRFIEEHLKYSNAITFILKNQIRYIKDVIRQLEVDYFSRPESNYDDFIFKFKDVASSHLESLIEDLKIEYIGYLKESNLDDMPILELEDDGLDFSSTASKIVLINELGILDLIRGNSPEISNTKLAKVLSKMTGLHPETIKRSINDLKKSYKNDPYKSENNIKKTESLFNLYDINKKGE